MKDLLWVGAKFWSIWTEPKEKTWSDMWLSTWPIHAKTMADVDSMEIKKKESNMNVWNQQQDLSSSKYLDRKQMNEIHTRMIAKWFTSEDIITDLQNRWYEIEWWREHEEQHEKDTKKKDKWILSKFWDIIKERWSNIWDLIKGEWLWFEEVQQRASEWASKLEIANMITNKIQMWGLFAAWEVAGWLSDMTFEVIKWFIPDNVKQWAKKLMTNIAKTEKWQLAMQKLWEWVKKFEERKAQDPENARIARWLESVLNLADFTGIWATFKGAKKLAKWWLNIADNVVWKLSKLELKWQWPSIWFNIIRKWGWDKVRQSKWYFMNQVTWLDKETRKVALETPDLLSKVQKWEITAESKIWDISKAFDIKKQEIWELWSAYWNIRSVDADIDVSWIKRAWQDVLEANDIKVSSNWDISFAWTVFDKKEQKVIKEARWLINRKKKMKPREILNTRRLLDKMVDYRSEVTWDWERIVKWLRKQLNNIAHSKVKWLKELDAEFWPMMEEMTKLKKDRFNKDWSIKDSAHSKITNLTNTANIQRLARLEKIMPWISKDIRALKAVDDINKASAFKVWNYARQFWLVWGGIATGNPLLIAAGIATQPAFIIALLKKAWKIKWKRRIIKKIEQWLQVTDADVNIINRLIKSKYPQIYRKGRQQIENIGAPQKVTDLWKEITNKALPDKSIWWFVNEVWNQKSIWWDIKVSNETTKWFWTRRNSYVNDWLDLAGIDKIDDLPIELQDELTLIARRGAMGDPVKTFELTEGRLNKVEKWKWERKWIKELWKEDINAKDILDKENANADINISNNNVISNKQNNVNESIPQLKTTVKSDKYIKPKTSKLSTEAKKHTSFDSFKESVWKSYHWTNSNFDKFDAKKINTVESAWDYIWEWFFFTTNKSQADKYAQQAIKRKWWSKYIKEVYLDMKNPIVIKSKKDIESLNNIFWWEEKRLELMIDNPSAIKKKLQDLWYDWLIDKRYWQRAVFDTSQIIDEKKLKKIREEANKK